MRSVPAAGAGDDRQGTSCRRQVRAARAGAVARERGADLIVVGSRGHAGLRRLIERSVAHYVVDHAHCPVEVVHAKESTGGEDG